MPPTSLHRLFGTLGGCVLLAALYFLSAQIVIALTHRIEAASLFWAPAGLALAWLVRWNWIHVVGLYLGALLLALEPSSSLGFAALAALVATVGPASGALLLRRGAVFRTHVEHPAHLLLLFLSAAICATSTALATALLELLPASVAWPWSAAASYLWWWGCFVGVMVVAPVLLAWPSRPLRGLSLHTLLARVSIKEPSIYLAALLAVISVLAFDVVGTQVEQILLAISTAPLLVFAAWRLGPWQVAVTSVLLMLAAIRKPGDTTNTAHMGDLATTLHVTLFVASCHAVSLAIAVALIQRNRVQQTLALSEEQLRRSTERFEFLVSATEAISYSFALPDFRTTFISDNVLHVLGYRPEQFLADPNFFFQLVHPDDRPLVPHTAEALAGSDMRLYEYRLRLPDGSYRWLRDSLRVVRVNGEPRECIGSMMDITDSKRAEEALAATEQRLRTILDGSAAFFALLSRDGVLLEVNKAPLEVTKNSRDDVLGKPLWETYGWSYSQAEQQRLRGMVERAAQGEFVQDDFDVITPDGRMLTLESRLMPLYENGRIDKIVGSAIDVTERKRVERALRASEQRLRLLLETATLAASTLDFERLLERLMDRFAEVIPTADLGAIHLWDAERGDLYPAAYRGFDKEAHQQIRLLPGEAVAGNVFQRGKSLRTTSRQQSTELRGQLRPENERLLERIRGHREIISDIATPLRTPDGETLGVLTMSSTVAVFQDEDLALLEGIAAYSAIAVQNARSYQQKKSYAVELEQTVERRTADLRRANLELESFVHTVAHDLRAPLRAMQGFTRALQEDCGSQLDANGHHYIEHIVAAAQNMDQLVQDLLTYSRIGRTDIIFAPVELEQVLNEAHDLALHDRAPNSVDFQIDHPLPTVRAHRSLLVQVFANLLSNAVKFVSAQRSPRVRVWAEPRDGHWRIWVEDNGIGIAPENQARIFRVFERLHGIEQYPGTGIGLAIVARACNWMGGTCGVESQPGAGSRFWIELPEG